MRGYYYASQNKAIGFDMYLGGLWFLDRYQNELISLFKLPHGTIIGYFHLYKYTQIGFLHRCCKNFYSE